MPTNEKEITVNLLREKQHLTRVRKVASKENATIQEVLEAIDDEISDIDMMLYQEPPRNNNYTREQN